MATISSLYKHIKFLRKKPLVIPRVLKGFYKTNVLRKKVLRSVDWAVSYRCNGKCVMCSARKLYDSKRDEMTLNERKKVWKQAHKLGAIHTQFTGGEPMIKGVDWICKALSNLNPKSTLVSMTTNAQLLTKDKLDKMHKAGLDTIQISLDSMNFKTHNRLRGLKNNYSHIMKMFRYAREIGMNVGLGCVAAKNNLNEIHKLANFTKKEKVHLAVNRVSNPENWLTDDYKLFLAKDYKEYKKILGIPHVRTDTFLNFNGKSGCPSGERIEITAYGDVMPCPQVQISFGNVLEEPLKDIWERMCNSPLFKERCSECRWAWDPKFYKLYIKPYEKLKKRPVHINKVLKDVEEKTGGIYCPKF